MHKMIRRRSVETWGELVESILDSHYPVTGTDTCCGS